MTKKAADPQDLLRPQEAARRLNVQTRTLARWSAEGRINAITLPSGRLRYRLADIEAIERGEATA